MTESKAIIGRVERVWLPDLLPEEHSGVLAKVDTGADSGALHCTFVRYLEDEDIVEYQALDEDHDIVRTNEFTRVRTRSSNGETQRRFRVKSRIVIRENEYPIEITLTDRSDMKYDMILGWKFIADKFLIDVSEPEEESSLKTD